MARLPNPDPPHKFATDPPGTTRLTAVTLPLDLLEVPRPHLAKRLDGRQHRKPFRRFRSAQCVQEIEAVLADLARVGLPFCLAPWQPSVFDPPAIALVPGRWCKLAQPLRSRRGRGIEGR